MKTLLITGYKSSELGIFKQNDPAVYYIKLAIRRSLIPMIEEGLEWVIISGQLGTEIWAAEEVYSLKEEYPNVKLAVLEPFYNQDANWNEANKELYESITAKADFKDTISKRNYESPQQFKNKNSFLVDKTDGLLLLYDEERPGTPKFMLEAAKAIQQIRPYEIIQLTFYDLQLVVEDLQEQERRD
ncbi:DUF1273 domain-containing protein [Metabacillus sp. GX 13764]|uniref:DUF1273 domain-containing protein n=1 Tax=Metabacillus kandeliae TaxID=2900151 RepID=UPI001E56DDCC|nr:DUF1273 domain-containing protein [Metabacillus kandeliae]MCD7033417.1 DUF1273 domain-containing protein [Metabacillus kandeliae]